MLLRLSSFLIIIYNINNSHLYCTSPMEDRISKQQKEFYLQSAKKLWNLLSY